MLTGVMLITISNSATTVTENVAKDGQSASTLM